MFESDISLSSKEAREISDRLVSRIHECEAFDDPFCHIHLERVFSDETYATLLCLLPDHPQYLPTFHSDAIRPNGSSTRLVIPIDSKNLSRMSVEQQRFWSAVGVAFQSEFVKIALFQKLGRDIGLRFGVSPDSVSEIKSYSQLALLKDKAGYRISPHPDVMQKIVTFQVYLPADMLQIELGTTIYRSRVDTVSTDNKGVLDVVKTFEFMPNAGYAFAVSENSWHGCDSIPTGIGDRHSLLLVHYVEPHVGCR